MLYLAVPKFPFIKIGIVTCAFKWGGGILFSVVFFTLDLCIWLEDLFTLYVSCSRQNLRK